MPKTTQNVTDNLNVTTTSDKTPEKNTTSTEVPAPEPIIDKNDKSLSINPGIVGIGVINTYTKQEVQIGDTEIYVMDATNFPNQGTFYMEGEPITFKGKRDDTIFINCSPVKRHHNAGVFIYYGDQFFSFPGGKAHYALEIHNGINEMKSELKSVVTEANETVADIPVKCQLYGDITGVALLTDNPNDNLKIESYDAATKTFRISGFAPAAKRILGINYKYYATFCLETKLPDNPIEGFECPPEYVLDWITISDPEPVMMPYETKSIDVTLEIPYKTKDDLPQQWEYMIYLYDKSGGQVQVAVASRGLVGMR